MAPEEDPMTRARTQRPFHLALTALFVLFTIASALTTLNEWLRLV
jgi:hypothetical protein